MVRYFYDLEFLEDGRVIDLISIGIVAEDGREYYAVNADADGERISTHPWLMENVIPHLPYKRSGVTGWYWPDDSTPEVKPHAVIAAEVEAFIAEGGSNRDEHELWAYYGAYDHVALCQLWGPMVKLPACVPMWTHDLMQALDAMRGSEKPITDFVPQESEHHALADARWNRRVYDWRFRE